MKRTACCNCRQEGEIPVLLKCFSFYINSFTRHTLWKVKRVLNGYLIIENKNQHEKIY